MKISKKSIIIASGSILATLSIGINAYFLEFRNINNVSAYYNDVEHFESNRNDEATQEIKSLEYVASPNELVKSAENLLKINADTVGYIKINNTMVNYPIVQIPDNADKGNSYYLDHDIYYNYAIEGSIFLDYRNDFCADENMQSDNLVIYGHNMVNDTMFGSLSLYRTDYSFYIENSIIELSSSYEDYKYKIFGFFIVSGASTSDFKYWNCHNFESEDDFNDYLTNVRKRSLVDIDVDVEYGDKLIALSTCYSSGNNSRFVVVARRLRDGETT